MNKIRLITSIEDATTATCVQLRFFRTDAMAYIWGDISAFDILSTGIDRSCQFKSIRLGNSRVDRIGWSIIDAF